MSSSERLSGQQALACAREYAKDKANTAIKFGALARVLRARGITPHLQSNLCAHEAMGAYNVVVQRLPPATLKKMKTLRQQGDDTSNALNFVVVEPWCNAGDLESHLRKGAMNEAELRAVLFQVLYTLAALQAIFPAFRHNDL